MKTTFFTLIAAVLLLVSCQQEEPEPIQANLYQFSCVTGADQQPNQTYYFQISFGDTLNSTGNDLIDYDFSYISHDTQTPDNFFINSDTLPLSGKYCVMMAFYLSSGFPIFINSSFYATKGGINFFSECAHSGHCTPFKIL